MAERLYKSRDDRILAGVAGGVAEMIDADPSIIRVVWAVLIILTGGIALLVYIVMAIVVPDAPDVDPGSIGASTAAGGLSAADAGRSSGGQAGPGGWLAPDGSTVPMASAAGRGRRARQRDPADRARGGFVAGLILIVIGAFFLVRQLVPAIDPDLWWPVAAIVLGVILAVMALLPPRHRD